MENHLLRSYSYKKRSKVFYFHINSSDSSCYQPMIPHHHKKENAQKILLFLLRIWFGYTMMDNGRFIFDKSNQDFFLNWFGNELHFPAPLLMFYLAKGSEFFGGLMIFTGLITRIAASFVAFTMLVATLTANRFHIYGGDGSITISLFLFAILFVYTGGGKWSLDYLVFIRKKGESVKINRLI